MSSPLPGNKRSRNQTVVWQPQAGSQVSFITCPFYEVLLEGNRGGGKAQPLDSEICTPWGFKKMGEMRVGSIISNPDGSNSRVIGVYPQGKKKTFKISFSDNTFTHCTEDHLWFTKIANMNKPKRRSMFSPLGFTGKIHTTKELKKTLETGNGFSPLVPCTHAVNFNNYNSPYFNYSFDPYLLGLLLGDGSLSREDVAFNTADQEIADYVHKFGFYNTTSTDVKDCIFFQIRRNNELYENLKNSKLRGTKSDTKFIPKKYLYSSIEDRLALLQGLMDTDGDANSGKAYFSSTSRQLINDTRFLIQSLGGWCTLTGGDEGHQLRYKLKDGTYKDTKKGWGLYVRLPNQKDLFRLERKKANCSNYMHGHLVRKIVSIDYSAYEETQCIKVDNPNGLYITDDFIVTHNTDVLIMDFLQDVGVGYGAAWRGILFRESFPQLSDIIAKCHKWIKQIFPSAGYNASDHVWTFKDGEQLLLRFMKNPTDYWNYHGHEYPWIGWEELTNWSTDECYRKMKACNRSSVPGIPRKYRATCNPSGPGHSWVKARFVTNTKSGKPFKDPIDGKVRVSIKSRMSENLKLLEADPDYMNTIRAAAGGDPKLEKAWLDGSWDILMGGFFTDLWDYYTHVLQRFQIPESWYVYRSFDWGSAKPWCISYIAESNGEQPQDFPFFIPNKSNFVINEIYGWNGIANEGDRATSQQIAEYALQRDKQIASMYNVRVRIGPADTGIWEVRDGSCISTNMNSHGLFWTRAYKGSGSRVAGWSLIRQMLSASVRKELVSPHLYFFEDAVHHIRTIPLMQHDLKNNEDINTDLEDHALDCLVQDTLVCTDKGLIPIKDLVGGTGKVLTVNGIYTEFNDCRLVKENAELIEVLFKDNTSLICTPNHEILTTSGFILAKDLTPIHDCIVSKEGKDICEQKEYLLFPKQFNNFVEKIIINAARTFKKVESVYIEQCMNFMQDLFQMGIMFIINWKILLKINSWTLNYCMDQNIVHYTIKENIKTYQVRHYQQRHNGMEVKKEKCGIKHIMKILKNPYTKKLKENVSIVKKYMILQGKKLIHFAAMLINQNIEENKDLTILQKSVLYVPNHLKQTNIDQEKHAIMVHANQNYVLGIKKVSLLKRKEDTYCLVVPKFHSFAVQNGIIVANSLRYGLTRKMTAMKRKKVNF